MVSITFDEFHAIRSRQRAADDARKRSTEKSNGATTARTTSIDGKISPRKITSRSPTISMKSARSQNAAEPSNAKHSETLAVAGSRISEVAPTSGSRLHEKGEPTKPAKVMGNRWNGLAAASLGRFVELFEVQVAVVAMIYLDLVASTAQLLPFLQVPGGDAAGAKDADLGVGDNTGSRDSTGAWAVRLVARLMQSFTGFTVICFAIEVAMLLAAFRGRFFKHLGYVLDLFVVSLCLHQELTGMGKGVRLLGALRVWRVARIMNTLLLSAEDVHNGTKETLRLAEKRSQDVDMDRRRLQESLRREIDARKRIDKMLRGYKDEVETLNEALKIAALDIAAAGVSSEDISGVEEKEPKRNKSGTSSSDSDTTSHRSSASSSGGGRGDSAADAREERTGVDDRANRESPSSTGRIFVFQDGSFQAR